MKTNHKIISGLIGLASMFGFAFVLAPTISAADIVKQACDKGGGGTIACEAQGDDVKNLVKPIVNTLLFIVGAASVIVVVIGGVMYTVSAGDSSKTKRAKDAILYAVVGLVVALFAYAIVNFVLTEVGG